MIQWIPNFIALAGGAILAVMIALNSGLSVYVGPLQASWTAHAVGAVTALIVWLLVGKTRPRPEHSVNAVPWWAYAGGLPGALLVMLAVITVNSFLGITGTLVLSILGQVVFGMVTDQFGWFGLQAHPVTKKKLLSIVPMGLGVMMIVYAQGALQ